MLVGIVKKNAIMMIDFAIESQRAGVKTLPMQFTKPAWFGSVRS